MAKLFSRNNNNQKAIFNLGLQRIRETKARKCEPRPHFRIKKKFLVDQHMAAVS